MRQIFILQFDVKDEPNETECTAIKLDGTSIQFKSIHPVTAADIYEAITGKTVWPDQLEKAGLYIKDIIPNKKGEVNG